MIHGGRPRRSHRERPGSRCRPRSSSSCRSARRTNGKDAWRPSWPTSCTTGTGFPTSWLRRPCLQGPAGQSHARARHAAGAQAAEYYANLLGSMGAGLLSYTMISHAAQLSGRANIRTQAIGLDDPARQARGKQGQEHRPLRADARRPAGSSPAPTATASGSRSAPRTRRRRGVHHVGHEQGDAEGVSLEKGYAAVSGARSSTIPPTGRR